MAQQGHWKQREKDEAVRELWGDSGLSLRGIARRVGMSPTGTAKAAERLGLPARQEWFCRKDEKLQQVFRESPGRSLRSIAREVGMSPTGTKKAMLRLGLCQETPAPEKT